MALAVEISSRPDPSGTTATFVRLVGVLDAASAGEAQKTLLKMAAESPPVVVLDLAQLSFLDSSGISVILSTRQAIKKGGGTVVMTNLQKPIRKVFEIIKALPDVNVFETKAELDAYLAHVQKKSRDGDDE